MTSIIAPMTSVLCGSFCFIVCVLCCGKIRPSHEKREERRPDLITKKMEEESPLVVGADLAVENIECTICMEEYEVGQKLTVLSCMHFYHEDCIKTWYNDNNECPQCRETIQVVVID